MSRPPVQGNLPQHINEIKYTFPLPFTAQHLLILREYIADDTTDVNAFDERGRTLLHWVSGPTNKGLALATKVDLAQRLLARGADINFCDQDGWTALHTAAWGNVPGAVEMVSCLVAAGADLEKRFYSAKNSLTPLGGALNHHGRAIGIAAILVGLHGVHAGASLDSVWGDLTAEQRLAQERDSPHFHSLKELVKRARSTRTRRNIARLRSYATRGRASVGVRLLDRRTLTTVHYYNSLFGLPDELFKKIVRNI